MKKSAHPVPVVTKGIKKAKYDYKGDGFRTCRICGKYLPFETHSSLIWAWKRRKGTKTYNYCSYSCMRKDER